MAVQRGEIYFVNLNPVQRPRPQFVTASGSSSASPGELQIREVVNTPCPPAQNARPLEPS